LGLATLFPRAVAPPADRASNLNEELTDIVGGALRSSWWLLDVVPRSRTESTSSREQMETSGEQ